MRSHILALALCVPTILPLLPAQEPTPITQPAMPWAVGEVVPNSFIVTFATRSFTLEALRDATLAHRSADEVAAIVASMEAGVREDQAGFVAAVLALGGTVTDQWWIINGACVTLPAAKRAALAALPNVASVTENRVYHAIIDSARNATHHNSAAANLKKDKANVNFVRGKGMFMITEFVPTDERTNDRFPCF